MTLSPKLAWELANPRWASEINPVLNNPLSKGQILSNVAVTTGTNVIDHGLGRKLQGWIVVMMNAGVTLYDSQSSNQMPSLTLILNASGNATISLYVF